MKVVKIIEVDNCKDCPHWKWSSNLFGASIVCIAGLIDKVIASKDSPYSMLNFKNKVHDTCPFRKLDINAKQN